MLRISAASMRNKQTQRILLCVKTQIRYLENYLHFPTPSLSYRNVEVQLS